MDWGKQWKSSTLSGE
ncbi:unnamed protein product, partial [Allacma fusca]